MPSCPIEAMNRPRKPAIHPFSGSLPVRLPEITTPNTASQKNSYAPNFSAASPSTGVNKASAIIPIQVPSTEPVVAIPMARPARPCRANA